jgi:hypothetical protein
MVLWDLGVGLGFERIWDLGSDLGFGSWVLWVLGVVGLFVALFGRIVWIVILSKFESY